MRKAVGIFGGTFDPIHFGHISLALQLQEIHQLDEVLFIPAFCSPFKTDTPPVASPKERLAMVKLAVSDIPHFNASSVEIEREGPSFTIDTLRALQSSAAQLHLLLSEEAARFFPKWKEAEEILHLAPPFIGSRIGSHVKNPTGCPSTPTRAMEISSTEIRERLKKKLYCGHLVPAKALDYIHMHCLYSS